MRQKKKNSEENECIIRRGCLAAARKWLTDRSAPRTLWPSSLGCHKDHQSPFVRCEGQCPGHWQCLRSSCGWNKRKVIINVNTTIIVAIIIITATTIIITTITILIPAIIIVIILTTNYWVNIQPILKDKNIHLILNVMNVPLILKIMHIH